MKGLIIKSAIYPVILILVIIVVVAIMMIKIVPTFTSQFDEVGGKLPGITLAVMAVSDFFVHSWYFIVAIIAGILPIGFFLQRIPKVRTVCNCILSKYTGYSI